MIKMAGAERVLKRQIINSDHPFIFFMAFTIFPLRDFSRKRRGCGASGKMLSWQPCRTKSCPYRRGGRRAGGAALRRAELRRLPAAPGPCRAGLGWGGCAGPCRMERP